MSRKSVFVAVAAMAVLVASVSRVSADGAKGTAVVKGKVTFDGTPPAMKALPAMNADKVCATANPKSSPDQATIVYAKDGNTIPYAFVYMKEGVKDKYDAPKDSAVINQKGCIYHPHVFGMIAGQQLEIKSEDPTAHNIHALPKKNTEFNLAQPNVGTIKREGKDTFNKPEMAIKFKCDVHGWMSSWCHVMSHPFFDVTKDHLDFPGKNDKGEENKDNKAKWGTFEIKDLPAGDYTIEAWHETFGTAQMKVSVKDGETKEVEIKMTGKKAEGPSSPERVILASEVTGGKKACCAKEAACDKDAKSVTKVAGK